MCGIVGYIGKNKIFLSDLITYAQSNKWRGDEGVGLIYKKDDRLMYNKYLYTLDELATATLDEDRTKSSKDFGNVIATAFDEEEYKKKQDEFYNEIIEILGTQTEFAFLHHRKATYGGECLENLHPFEYKDKLYLHNGTATINPIKRYLELNEGIVFTSETDSEVLGFVFDYLKNKCNSDDEIYSEFSEMFSDGFGILIEISNDFSVNIIKDSLRDLWVYESEDNWDKLFISEPLATISMYPQLGYLKCDLHRFYLIPMADQVDTYNVVDRSKANEFVLDLWQKELKVSNNEIEERAKCDKCKTKKRVLTLSYNISDHFGKNVSNDDYCYECMVTWYRETKKDKTYVTTSLEEDKVNEAKGYKAIYEDYLGENINA